MNLNPFKGKGYKGKLIGYYESIFFLLFKKKIKSLKAKQNTHGLSSKDMDSGSWFITIPNEKAEDCPCNTFYDSNQLLERKFSILGYEIEYENKAISWHLDPISQTTWQKKYFKLLYPVANTSDSSDCKMPWELSRFQHLPSIVKAHKISEDPRYSKEAICQIDDWIKENPCPYGINWTCAMEVAIRACNWIWAWWAFKDDLKWSKTFDQKFLKCIWQHGWFIENNLENKRGIRTNHYLSNVVGLLFIGLMFPGLKDSEKWKTFGAKELTRCMEEMVYKDGVSFENSIAYHRLVIELFTYSALLCKKNNIDLPQSFWLRLEKMFEFILYAMRPDGRMPMIGDSDDGRFFIFSNYYNWDRWDFRYLLSIGGVLFKRSDFKKAAGNTHDEIYWLFEKKKSNSSSYF